MECVATASLVASAASWPPVGPHSAAIIRETGTMSGEHKGAAGEHSLDHLAFGMMFCTQAKTTKHSVSTMAGTHQAPKRAGLDSRQCSVKISPRSALELRTNCRTCSKCTESSLHEQTRSAKRNAPGKKRGQIACTNNSQQPTHASYNPAYWACLSCRWSRFPCPK